MIHAAPLCWNSCLYENYGCRRACGCRKCNFLPLIQIIHAAVRDMMGFLPCNRPDNSLRSKGELFCLYSLVLTVHFMVFFSPRWPLTSQLPMEILGTAARCTTSTRTSPMNTWRPWLQWERSVRTMTGWAPFFVCFLVRAGCVAIPYNRSFYAHILLWNPQLQNGKKRDRQCCL